MESAETDYLNETRVRLPPHTCLVDLSVRGTNRTIYYLYSLILYWLEYIVHPFPHFVELGGGNHDMIFPHGQVTAAKVITEGSCIPNKGGVLIESLPLRVLNACVWSS